MLISSQCWFPRDLTFATASIRRGVRASSTPSVQNEERNEDGIEEQNDVGQEEERRDIDDEGEGDDGQQSAPDLGNLECPDHHELTLLAF